MVQWHKGVVSLLVVLAFLPGRLSAQRGGLTFDCTDERLRQCFEWAKAQALQYAHRGDPVGAWYEAALPNREGF